MSSDGVKYNHLVPLYWPVYPLLYCLAYKISTSPYRPLIVVFYITTWCINPFADWRIWFRLVRRSLSGRYENLPLRFNLVGLAPLLWFAMVQWPIETCLWYLDEIFFSNYTQTKVWEPVFLLGQPRSGTTKFQEVLAANEDEFCSMLLWEMRFPYLTVQYIVDFACRTDKVLFCGRCRRMLTKAGLMNTIPQGKELQKMRRMQFDKVDEDDVIFCFHGLFHLTLLAMFPDPQLVSSFYEMSDLPTGTRSRYMEFHRRAVQKMMYRRGHGRRYLCKWVTGWNGLLEESSRLYPDAKYVMIARDPRKQLPSWMKLQGLFAESVSGINTIRDIPAIREAVMKINTQWYLRQYTFCEGRNKAKQFTKPSESIILVSFENFVQNIPQQIRKVYGFLNLPISLEYEALLSDHHERQNRHKTTIISKKEAVVEDDTINKIVEISLWATLNRGSVTSPEEVPSVRDSRTNRVPDSRIKAAAMAA